mmetsp:Transcript_20054/g.37912  ORF Transcript_20054/g.37912 Transcript_20054/m.37912 type:complete len:403 (-) Transcript_20054:73-1281(-)
MSTDEDKEEEALVAASGSDAAPETLAAVQADSLEPTAAENIGDSCARPACGQVGEASSLPSGADGGSEELHTQCICAPEVEAVEAMRGQASELCTEPRCAQESEGSECVPTSSTATGGELCPSCVHQLQSSDRVLTISTATGGSEICTESLCGQVVEECPICFEEPTRRIELPCGHHYCADCLLKCVVQYGKRSCPTCRGELFNGQESPASSDDHQRALSRVNSFEFESSFGNGSPFPLEMYNGRSIARTFSYQSSDDTSPRSDSSRLPPPLRSGLAQAPHVFDEPQEFMAHLSRRGLHRSSRGRGSFSLSSSSFETLPDFHTSLNAGPGGDVGVGHGFSFSDLPKWLFGVDCCQPVLRSSADPRRYIKCPTRPYDPRVRPLLSERSSATGSFFPQRDAFSN